MLSYVSFVVNNNETDVTATNLTSLLSYSKLHHTALLLSIVLLINYNERKGKRREEGRTEGR